MERVNCFECGSVNNYEFRKEIRKYKGEGYCFTMEAEVPFCKECGAPVEIEEIEQEISRKANIKIRESKGIIQREEILDILSKYNVSQKFLSKMLGWGEITLTRYINNGYTPNSANSRKLKSLKDPYVFQKLVNERMEDGCEYEETPKISNEALMKKLQGYISRYIESTEDNGGKICEAVNWFLNENTSELPVTHLALQKLLYFSQAWNKVWNGKWLFEDDCEAWIHGAVYRKIYDNFKKFRYNPLPKTEVSVRLTEEEIKVLQFVKKYYLDVYTAKTLEQICHLEQPYKEAREGYTQEDNCNTIIDKKSISDYYTLVAGKYDISISTPQNIKKYLNDLLA